MNQEGQSYLRNELAKVSRVNWCAWDDSSKAVMTELLPESQRVSKKLIMEVASWKT